MHWAVRPGRLTVHPKFHAYRRTRELAVLVGQHGARRTFDSRMERHLDFKFNVPAYEGCSENKWNNTCGESLIAKRNLTVTSLCCVFYKICYINFVGSIWKEHDEVTASFSYLYNCSEPCLRLGVLHCERARDTPKEKSLNHRPRASEFPRQATTLGL